MSYRLGAPELIIILVILFFLFGARRLPAMGRQDTSNSPAEPVHSRSLIVGLGIIFGVFGLLELVLWLAGGN